MNKRKIVKGGVLLLFAVTLLSCAVVALTGIFGASAKSVVAENSSKVGHISAPIEENATVSADGGTTKMSTADIAQAWVAAVESSSQSNQVTFVLQDDWTAQSDGTGRTYFGSNSAGFLQGQIYVPQNKNIKLDLNGHKIDRALTDQITYGSVIYMDTFSQLEICDSVGGGVITGGSNNEIGGGIYAEYADNLTINGGKICGNVATDGAGIYFVSLNGNPLVMNGGEISGNIASSSSGAGIAVATEDFTMNGGIICDNGDAASPFHGSGTVYAGSTFIMNGGEISGNRAHRYGGVRVGTFIMNGGFIKGNSGAMAVGGVYATSSFTMTGGEISGNTARANSGVYLSDDVMTVNIEGDARICDNGDGTDPKNLKLSSNTYFKITGELTGNAKICFSSSEGIKSVGYSRHNTANPADYFFTDDGVAVNIYEGEIYVGDVSAVDGWATTVLKALNTGVQQTYTLQADWTADADGNMGIGIGYNKGAIFVPAGASVIIDMNGYEIDRKLQAKQSNGEVLRVERGATLELCNSGGTCYLSGGYSSYGGGVYNQGTFILNGARIADNRATSGAGVYNQGTFVMENGQILENDATSSGGGVYNSGTFTLNSGNIVGNTATSGAGVCVGYGTFVMNGGNIGLLGRGGENIATEKGGGLYYSGSERYYCQLSGGKICNNQALNGAGVYCYGKNMKISGTTISQNVSSAGGAGVYVYEDYSLTIEAGEITGNVVNSSPSSDRANDSGGGVYLGQDSSLTINGGTISGNKAVWGGGIFASYKNVITMTGGTISNNTATRGGGIGDGDWGSTFNMSGGTISGNTASNDGGGIAVAKVNITGGEISGNSAKRGGGIASGATDTLKISKASITGNTATESGAGIWCASVLQLSGAVTIRGNKINSDDNNLYLFDNGVAKINVLGDLTGSRIGVTLGATTGVFTSGYYSSGSNPNYCTIYFFSDIGKEILYSSYELHVGTNDAVKPTALFTWRYGRSLTSGYQITTQTSVTISYTGGEILAGAYNGDQAVSSSKSYYTINGQQVWKIIDVGTYTLTVTNQPDYSNPVFTIYVIPAEVDITWSQTELRYTGLMQYPKPTLTGVKGGDQVSLVLDTSRAGTNAGNGYTISAVGLTGEKAFNYKIKAGAPTVYNYNILKTQHEKPSAGGALTYNGTEQTYGIGGVIADVMSVTGNVAKNAGNYVAKVSLINTTNHEWIDGTTSPVEINWVMNKLYVTATGGIQAEDKYYDGTTNVTFSPLGVEFVGILDADKGKLYVVQGTTVGGFTSPEVGAHMVRVDGLTLAGDAAVNYELANKSWVSFASILPAEITISGVTVENGGKVYDGTTDKINFLTGTAQFAIALDGNGNPKGAFPANPADLQALISDLQANLKVSGEYVTADVGNQGVAVYNYVLTGVYARRYNIDFANSEQLLPATISQRDVTVNIHDAETEFGKDPANLKYTIVAGNVVNGVTVDGLLSIDDLGVVLTKDANGLNGTTTVSGYDVGVYKISGTASNPNYNVIWVRVKADGTPTGNAPETQAEYTVTKGKVTITANISYIEYGDTAKLDGGLPVTVDATISASELAILMQSVRALVYDGTNLADYQSAYAQYASLGVPYEGGDIYDATGAKISYIVIPTGYSSPNFDIVYKPGKLVVEPKNIEVTIDDKNSHVYGDTTYETLTATVTDYSALVNFTGAVGDDVSAYLGISYNAITAVDAGVYTISANGWTNVNYRLNFVNGNYEIAQKEVYIVWTQEDANGNIEFTFDGTNLVPEIDTVDANGNALKDANGLILAEVRGGGRSAGTYGAQVFLKDGKNYKFAGTTTVDKAFTVKPKQIGIKWYKDDSSSTEIDLSVNNVNAPDGTPQAVTFDYVAGVAQAPVAKTTDILADDIANGVKLYVKGAQSMAQNGTYSATVYIVGVGSGNYEISNSFSICNFRIVKKSPSGFNWYEDKTYSNPATSNFLTYTYDGKAHQPWAKADIYDDFYYNVVLIDASGNVIGPVDAPVNAGKYRVKATPRDNSLDIGANDTFEFEILPLAVQVVWSGLKVEYNGSAQAPTAYYEALGQNVTLTVTGSGTNAGSYPVKVELTGDALNNFRFETDDPANAGQKILVTEIEETFTVEPKEIRVHWTYNSTDGWKERPYDGTDLSANFTCEAEWKNVATVNGVAEIVKPDIKVLWQAKAGDVPVDVTGKPIRDAGIYTLCAELPQTFAGNYKLVGDENGEPAQCFTITKPKLEITATDKTVNSGAELNGALEAVFGKEQADGTVVNGLVQGDTASSDLASINWLATNYTSSSLYIDETTYDYDNGIGYFIDLTDDKQTLDRVKEILKNYDWNFNYGKVIIIANPGEVRIVTTKVYNGENQLPGADYKTQQGDWKELKVTVMTDDTYTSIASNQEVINSGKYYLLLEKYDTDESTPLSKDRVEFVISKRKIEVKISDRKTDYGTITTGENGNYREYLVWAYTSQDPQYLPLGDALLNNLGIELDVEEWKKGDGNYATVAYDGTDNYSYKIIGTWDEVSYGDNYEVTFIGNDGKDDCGVYKINLAEINFFEKTGKYNQEDDKSGTITIALSGNPAKYFSFVGDQTAIPTITYGDKHDLDVEDLKDIPDPKNDIYVHANHYLNPENSDDAKKDKHYVINFKIELANHKVYYGRWTARILRGTVVVRVIFVKGYEIDYGDEVLDGKALAETLWDEGYLNTEYLSVIGGEKVFKQYVTAKIVADDTQNLNAGAYDVVLEGIESIPDAPSKYEVSYKENPFDDEVATNVGKFVINRRQLTVKWDKTSFVYDGEAHMPVPELEGWVKKSAVAGSDGTTVYSFFNEETDKTVELKVRTNGGDFTTVGSENVVIATVDDDNYVLDGFNATRAVSITGDIGGNTAPVQTDSGVPLWLIILVAVACVVAVVALVVVLVKRRSPAGDEDGFYDPADE